MSAKSSRQIDRTDSVLLTVVSRGYIRRRWTIITKDLESRSQFENSK